MSPSCILCKEGKIFTKLLKNDVHWHHINIKVLLHTEHGLFPLQKLISYLFININQLDALNFIISLFQASTCFEHMCSSSAGQKLYYTVSGIIIPIGGHPVHRLREDSLTKCTKFYNKFISSLYMFRAHVLIIRRAKIVLYSLWYHHTYRFSKHVEA